MTNIDNDLLDNLFEAAEAADELEVAARLKYNALELAQPFDRIAYEAATIVLEKAIRAEQRAWDACFNKLENS